MGSSSTAPKLPAFLSEMIIIVFHTHDHTHSLLSLAAHLINLGRHFLLPLSMRTLLWFGLKIDIDNFVKLTFRDLLEVNAFKNQRTPPLSGVLAVDHVEILVKREQD